MICQGFGRHAGARVAGQKATGVRRVKGGISRAMRAIRRVLVVVLGGLLILAAILLGGGYLWMRGSLPKTAGEVRIAALEAPVTVRDRKGVVSGKRVSGRVDLGGRSIIKKKITITTY